MSRVRAVACVGLLALCGCGVAGGRWRAADPRSADAVEPTTLAAVQVRKPGGRWSGEAASVAEGSPAVFHVRLVNVGEKAGRIRLREAALSVGWRARYFEGLSRRIEITDRVRDTGWYTPPLEPGQVVGVRLELAHPSAPAAGAGQVRLQAFADNVEAVLARAVPAARPRPAVRLRRVGEGTWSRAVRMELREGVTGRVEVSVANEGPGAARMRVSLLCGGEGWGVRATDPASGADLTPVMLGKGLAMDCAAGAVRRFLLAVTPRGAARADRLRLQVFAAAGGRRDAARCDVLMAGGYQPDLQAAPPGGPWAGEGVHSLSAEGQRIEVRPDARREASLRIRVRNDGDFADRFVLRESGHDARWLARYVLEGAGRGRDVTDALRGAGWTTPVLRPGEALVLRYRALPGAASEAKRLEVRLAAASAAVPRKGDVLVLAVVNVRRAARDAVRSGPGEGPETKSPSLRLRGEGRE